MSEASTVSFATDGPIAIVTIERPEARNAVNRATAQALAAAFRRFDADASLSVAILTGSGGYFCAGYDLKEVAGGSRAHRVESGDGPMGPTRLKLSKPVVAAVEGPAVAGGLELALWCDLRVASRDAIFGVYCRRFGVPLIDLGTIRLPRLIGHSRAMDLILTGRGISGEEAERIGLVNRVVAPGEALAAATKLAHELALGRRGIERIPARHQNSRERRDRSGRAAFRFRHRPSRHSGGQISPRWPTLVFIIC
jgi:enoyl-CoA hydratase